MNSEKYTEFLIMRHGQSAADVAVPKVFEGRLDTPLTETGVDQACRAAEWLAAKCPPQRIISSPLLRAMKTADIVAQRIGLHVEYTPELMERNNGVMAGLTKQVAEAKGFLPSGGYLPHETVCGGETLIEFRARAERFWSILLSQEKTGRRILVVSHGQMIAMLFRCFLKLPVDDSVCLRTCDTGIHCWQVSGTTRVLLFSNSCAHLNHGRAIA